MRVALAALTLSLSGVLTPGHIVAQALKPSPGVVVAQDSGARMERIAPNVYAIIHDDATEDWPHGNTGVIVGADGILVIDSNYLPARATDDIALIRRVSQLPVRYLLNTHWHGDHTHGNGAYQDAFPGISILGARESAGFVGLNQLKLPMGASREGSANRQTLARLVALRAAGRDSAGRALTPDELRALDVNIARRRFEQAELAKVKVAPPTTVFDERLTLDLGGRVVELRNMGRGNSPADVVAYLPAERVLFAGDLLVYPVPYATLVYPVSWRRILDELTTYPVNALVPGHGPVMADHQYTEAVRDVFRTIEVQVDSLYRLGYNLSQATDSVDVMHLRERFWVPAGRPVREAFWREWTQGLARQFAECVHGYRC